MTDALKHPVFRWLFAALVLSLLGVGLLTAALALAAFELGGVALGGLLLSGIFVLKMVAYVVLAPLAQAALAGVAPGRALILLDSVRLIVLLPLAFVSSWAVIGGLTFVFFAAAAAFTPLIQAIIPQILPDRQAYTQALSLSRLASTAETMLTPVFVGLALLIIPAPYLFSLAAACFTGSVLCLVRAPLGAARPKPVTPFWQRATRGVRIYLNTPRLQGLLAAHFGLSLAMAWVLVNTVVYAGARFGTAETAFPILMAGFGLGSAAMALALPRVLKRASERQVITGGALGFGVLTPLILLHLPLPALALLWAGFGAASSMTLTPGGLVLVRSAAEPNRPAVFAAQFSLSHAGWLIAYPLAGWLATELPTEWALVFLGLACAATTLFARHLWPVDEPEQRAHTHRDLPTDHPHLRDTATDGPDHHHSHVFYVDDLHPTWTLNEGRPA